MLEGAFMEEEEAGPQDNVYELLQDREDMERKLLPYDVSAPSSNGEGEGNLSRTSGNS